MQIARVLGGYSLGGADLLRRAMGKKNPEEMAKQKDVFLAGARNNGIDPKKAESIFDLMAKFAEYGFNKSHSAAYALVAYQTAYLKAHYPVEFMAALLTEDMSNTDKVVKNINDCREMGIEVLPPDINDSDASFSVKENSIRFGLGAVKGVGGAAVDAMIEARAAGSFASIQEFAERVDLRRVNKKVVESLIKCGAFDSTKAKRSSLIASLDEVMMLGQKMQQERESAQTSLFGEAETVRSCTNGRQMLPDIPEWDEKLLLSFEKEALGFFITGHPLNRYGSAIKRFATCSIAELPEQADRNEVRICGMVVSLKESVTKKGDRMGFATIEDLSGSVEIVTFPEVYAASAEHLKGDEPLIVSGTVDVGEKGVKIIATSIELLGSHQEKETSLVRLSLPSSLLDKAMINSLHGMLTSYSGTCAVVMQLNAPNRFNATLKLPDRFSVTPTDDLASNLKKLLGNHSVIFE